MVDCRDFIFTHILSDKTTLWVPELLCYCRGGGGISISQTIFFFSLFTKKKFTSSCCLEFDCLALINFRFTIHIIVEYIVIMGDPCSRALHFTVIISCFCWESLLLVLTILMGVSIIE